MLFACDERYRAESSNRDAGRRWDMVTLVLAVFTGWTAVLMFAAYLIWGPGALAKNYRNPLKQ